MYADSDANRDPNHDTRGCTRVNDQHWFLDWRHEVACGAGFWSASAGLSRLVEFVDQVIADELVRRHASTDGSSSIARFGAEDLLAMIRCGQTGRGVMAQLVWQMETVGEFVPMVLWLIAALPDVEFTPMDVVAVTLRAVLESGAGDEEDAMAWCAELTPDELLPDNQEFAAAVICAAQPWRGYRSANSGRR